MLGGPQGQNWKKTLGLTAALFVIVAALSTIPVIRDSEARLTDTYFRITPPQQHSPVVLVLIDDESLQRYGRWPWSRVLLAKILHNLHQAGAGVVGIDILLPESQSPEADQALREALEENRRAVIVDRIGSYPDGPRWIEPLPDFVRAAIAVGHAQAALDVDSVCRRFPARELTINGSRWAFAVEVARHTDSRAAGDFLASYGVPSNDDSSPITTAPVTLVPISYRRQQFDTLSASTAIEGGNLPLVRGRPVLLGFGSGDTTDRLTTPLTTELPTPGIEVHAQILDAILNGRKLREVPWWISALVLLGSCVVAVLCFGRWRGWSAVPGFALLAAAFYLTGWLAFLASFLLPAGSMMLASAVGPLLVYTSDFVIVERSLGRQLREVRSWLASQTQRDTAAATDLSWKLGLLQKLQTELGSLYELHRTLLESTQDLVALFNEKGELLLQNQALSAVCPAGASGGLSLLELQSRWKISEEAPITEHGQIREGEVNLGGELYSVRILPLPPTTLSPRGGTIVTLSSLRARAERDHARSEALGFITHELRTPLASIQGYAQLMMQYPDAEECKQAPETIYWESKRLLALINSYLDVLRLDAGAKSLANDVLDAEEMVRRVFDILQPLATAAKMRLVVECPAPITMIGDSALLQGAVLNLVSNAIKYGKAGSDIRVVCGRDKGEISLAVHNVGPPIPPESLARLFDAYYRAPSVEKSKVGWGLGLAFVKRIAEKHGGSIRAESVPTENFFELRLPDRVENEAGTREVR